MRVKLFSMLVFLLMAVTGVWAQTDRETPLTLEAMTDGVSVSVTVSGSSTVPSSMMYQINNSEKTAVVEGSAYILNEGEIIKFYGNAASYYNVTISCSDGGCYAYGNVMSLVAGDDYATATTLTEDNAFKGLFSGNSNLYSHPTKKLVLPATTLKDYCYQEMFRNCSRLTVAPELPATTLARNCYYQMFNGCSHLTVAPELPATTLANYCYREMFRNCTSLTTAPVLPATTLANYCYYQMFKDCTSLKSVTCLATNISASYATNNWLDGVEDSEGTFIKANSMTGWAEESASGIPSGWTTLNYTVTLTDGEAITPLNDYAGNTCEVIYTRSFTEGKASTVFLPFAYSPKTGEKFYTFTGITKDDEGNYTANMTEVVSPLAPNTPYLFIPTGDADFSGIYTIPASIEAGSTTSGDWKFIGTFETKEWATAPETPTYGFSAQDANDGITQGQFVKVGDRVRIKPMRAYLEYNGSASEFANARSMSATAAGQLPKTIGVRLIGADGEVTAVATLNTRTGEVTLDGWYTLDGKRLSAQPTRKGIYVNNGKKVFINK